VTESTSIDWHAQPGVMLAHRYLRTHPIPVASTPLARLPRLSKRVIRFALRLNAGFFDRADFSFPIIVAGKGWYKIALDGRHRIAKATWTGRSELPTVRVPLRFAVELLLPGVYEVEWLGLFLGRRLRKSMTLHSTLPA
jgi:hypothetical protein